MTKEKIRKSALCLMGSFMLSGILAVLADLAVAWNGIEVPCSLFLLGAALLTVLFFVRYKRKPGNAVKAAVRVMLLFLVTVGLLFICWKTFSEGAAYGDLDDGKKQLYADRKVLLLVPHQDDDINVLGGVMEAYVRYGSQVYPVFITNGDFDGLAEERFREALDVFAYIGIPEENVIFLGYGDTWKEGGAHLYNAPEGAVVESAFGRTETYGTQVKDVWRPGAAYTVDNLLTDIRDVILTIRPDVIFCCDYDLHIDHRANSLAFEKVMGRILREEPDYRPLVFKGYAYNTAWYAQADFHETNLLSTRNVFGDPHFQTPAVYRWEERLRLPVADETLSRSLFSCDIFRALERYVSQEAHFQAARIINGDKVFWYRDTNSLCYGEVFQVSSGDGALLNDFMLLENLALTEEDRMPADGTWIPGDSEKTASVSFPQTVSIEQIRLYDNPSPTDNVLSGSIVFDDGTEINFGPLPEEGAGMAIHVDKRQVTSFTVKLAETEGENAGLTEIEAFETAPSHGMRYIKLMDTDDNFVYDWLTDGAEGWLDVYTQGLTGKEAENLTLSWNSTKCWAEFEEGRIRVICPEGTSMILTVAVEGTDLSDTVMVRNPGKLERLHLWLGQTLEKQVFQKYCDGYHRKSATYKLLMTALELF